MKKLIILFAIVAATAASAQSKKDSIALTDSTVFLSIRDLYRFADPYKDKATGRQWEDFKAVLDAVLRDAITEWNKKKKH